jgi:hypothetical protein
VACYSHMDEKRAMLPCAGVSLWINMPSAAFTRLVLGNARTQSGVIRREKVQPAE